MSKKILLVLVMALVLIMAVSGIAMASGDGSGGGGGTNPLTLESSTIEDGATDIASDAVIELTFSNNVVNASVADNNMASFALYQDGEQVAIEVIMADDQVEPQYKEIITIQPVEPLVSGAAYELVIMADLQSKNGITFGEDMTIAFTTQDAATDAPEPELISEEVETTDAGTNNNWIYYIILALVAVIIVYLLIKRRNAK